ncbi:MAG TPA: SxtJ family membrane protein [Bryobacteraceae bacterium]|nr:SxtJ family membrane protein [Bryobacteraceae bacterium]
MTSTHEHFESEAPPRPVSDRTFGVVFFVVSMVFAAFPLLRHGSLRQWALWPAGAFLLLALIAPRVLHPLNIAWTALAVLLGKITGRVTMAVIFYAVFVPVSLLMRAMRKDPLLLRRDANAKSYWSRRVPDSVSRESLRDQF